ncbi:hypothetical protein DFH06DRAFT_1215680 [Mycena polygramma]|nr:hypothetical protein DFH06DRAFT_1215680 [Mycena polygramma]
MWPKTLIALASLFVLSTAAPLSSNSRASALFQLGGDGPLTDADGYRCTQSYTVGPGDTCETIAMAFGLRPETFIHMNRDREIGEDCSTLKIGTQLCVQTVMTENPARVLVLNGAQ